MYAKCENRLMLKGVEHDAIFRCGHLDCNGNGTCEMWGLGQNALELLKQMQHELHGVQCSWQNA
jgi:hypothetical protein